MAQEMWGFAPKEHNPVIKTWRQLDIVLGLF